MAIELKRAFSKLLDKAFSQEGYVLEIRKWQPAYLYEVDLHLPGVDMMKWNSIQRLKCKVAELEYRDYTPASWNADKKICTVLIETAHAGCGSSWTKKLQAGDTILFGPAYATRLPDEEGKILCLGDGSALGHFLALKQLTIREDYPMEAVICLNEEYILPDAFKLQNPEFEMVMRPGENSLDILQQYAEDKTLENYTSIYIAGYIPMVQGLKKFFKKYPYLNARIFANGFWS